MIMEGGREGVSEGGREALHLVCGMVPFVRHDHGGREGGREGEREGGIEGGRE